MNINDPRCSWQIKKKGLPQGLIFLYVLFSVFMQLVNQNLQFKMKCGRLKSKVTL